jgi:hypothetical protein
MNDPMEGFFRPSKLLKGKINYKRIVQSVTDAKSEIGIACFSETYDNILMWAHYAGNYTGICLSYSSTDLLDGLPDEANLVRLAYVDEPPQLLASHTKETNDAAIRVLSQKQYNWAYEREWRVLGSTGPMIYAPNQALRRIFFGSRIDPDHKNEIIAASRGTSIELYMMEISGYHRFWEPIHTRPRKRSVKLK